MVFIKLIFLIVLTSLNIKLYYQKTDSFQMLIGRSLKVALIPCIVYAVTEVLLMTFVKMISTVSIALIIFSEFMTNIVPVAIFYFLLKEALIQDTNDSNVAKIIAGNVVKYFVLLIILVEIGIIYLVSQLGRI